MSDENGFFLLKTQQQQQQKFWLCVFFHFSLVSRWCFRRTWVLVVSCLPAVRVCLKTARWAALCHTPCCHSKDKVTFNYSEHRLIEAPHWPDLDQNKSSITEHVLVSVSGKRRNIQWDVQEVSETNWSCSDWRGKSNQIESNRIKSNQIKSNQI